MRLGWLAWASVWSRCIGVRCAVVWCGLLELSAATVYGGVLQRSRGEGICNAERCIGVIRCIPFLERKFEEVESETENTG